MKQTHPCGDVFLCLVMMLDLLALMEGVKNDCTISPHMRLMGFRLRTVHVNFCGVLLIEEHF